MSYFPFFMDIEGETALVAGGGMVAYRKTAALLEFGAVVRVVADELCQPFLDLHRQYPRQMELSRRKFCDRDLEDVLFVIAATNDAQVNHHISTLCRERGILVNAADRREDCSFYFPSYVKRGELVAGVSSGGNSPALARTVRGRLEEQMPDYYGELNEQLGMVRRRVKAEITAPSDRRRCLEEMLARAEERQGLLREEEIEEILRGQM